MIRSTTTSFCNYRRIRRISNNNCFLCLAIPLLRICLSTSGHQTYSRFWGTGLSFSAAFSPVTRRDFLLPREETFLRLISTSSQEAAIPSDWASLRVVDLKEELRKRGLRLSGNKAELVGRLEDDDMARKNTKANVGDDERTRRTSPRKKPKTTSSVEKETEGSHSKAPAKKAASKAPAKKAASDHQRITEIDELPKLWNDDMAKANGSYTFKIASWNVAGLRALVKKTPNALAALCEKHNLDMLCLQEHKLQEMHLEDPKLKLKGLMDDAGYDEYWSCSTAKKGYSGTSVFVRRQKGSSKGGTKQATIGSFFSKSKKGANQNTKQSTVTSLPFEAEKLMPSKVTYSVGEEIDNEGRVVLLEFPWATLANVYVPNSGQKLERLEYRTKEWDKFFLKFMQDLETKRGLPVMWLGDLNIAHKAYDIWNDGAKHLAKQAGVTEAERESFTEQLASGFVDVFRKLHPTAKGNYSYWSQRAGNREPNKGLRLDYFVASEQMFHEDSQVVPRDSYMIMDQYGSDHAPVVVELEIKA